MSASMPYKRAEGIYRSQGNMREQLRFPIALKQARLARQLKQETLAAQLHVKLRTLVSWETGTRIPSVGMVALLSQVLAEDFDLEHDLVRAYIADDLARQTYLQKNEQFRQLALYTLEQFQARGHQLEQHRENLSLPGNRREEGGLEQRADQVESRQQGHSLDQATGDPLRQLFIVLDTLREHTELLPVVQDFLEEVTAQSM
jgi:transcriptional regulator with XRE-family HTH domain